MISGQSLVGRSSISAELSDSAREGWLEEFWVVQVSEKPYYKDFFIETPDAAHRSAVRQLDEWLSTCEDNENSLLLLLNLEGLLKGFIDYMMEKKSKAAKIFAEDEECRSELRAFMAVKILEAKVDEEKRGETAFFSPFARQEVTRRAFLKENRGFLHEALNALVKGVRNNPDRLGDLRDEDTSKIMRLFEVIIGSKLDQLFGRMSGGLPTAFADALPGWSDGRILRFPKEEPEL